MIVVPKAVEEMADKMITGTVRGAAPASFGDMHAIVTGVRDGKEAKDMKKRIS